MTTTPRRTLAPPRRTADAGGDTGHADDAAAPAARVLLASVDGWFSRQALREAMRLAGPRGGVYVVSTARVYGSGFGLPHPGLYPNRSEREAHRKAVADAVRAVERTGRAARGEVLATRHAAKMVARSARKQGCTRIVVGAAPRPRFTMLSWAGEPYRLERRAKVPVHLVVDDS
ncbi:MAG: hypothetical protein ACRDMV_11450 [Streptosporangiales bacterium]